MTDKLTLDRPAEHFGGIVAVAGAVDMEVSGIRRLGAFRRAQAGGLTYYKGDIQGRDVAVFVSGIGEARAYETAKAICSALPVTAFISVGLSAALSAELRPGDIVVGVKTEHLEKNGRQEYHSDQELLGFAMRALGEDGGARFGPLLASGSVVSTSKNKKEVAEAHKAVALDMETFGAARACAEQGVPFIAVRAISDSLDEDLPVDFNRFMKGASLDWPRFMLYIITHPGVIPGLMRLGKNSRTAARNLAEAVEALLVKL